MSVTRISILAFALRHESIVACKGETGFHSLTCLPKTMFLTSFQIFSLWPAKLALFSALRVVCASVVIDFQKIAEHSSCFSCVIVLNAENSYTFPAFEIEYSTFFNFCLSVNE